jgi:hypothetical protein
MRYGVLILLVLGIAGCNDTVKLRNQKTGQEITCGGGISVPGRPSNIDRCVKLMGEAGFKKEDPQN